MNAPTTTSNCPLCGAPLSNDANACTKCDWFRGYNEQNSFTYDINSRDVAAAVLSIVPGAGHVFKGHDMVGWMLMMGVPVVMVLAFAFTMFFGWLLVPVYWFAVGVDAFLRKDLRARQGAHPTGSRVNSFLDIR